MSARQRLPNRRASVSFNVEALGLKFVCTASRFPDGSLAEIFVQNGKINSSAGILAADAAIAANLALQHGVDLDTLRRGLAA